MIDRFRLPLTFDAAALQADLRTLSAEGWIPHFNSGFYDGDWSGLVLRGPTEGGESLLAIGEAFADTPLLDLCPGVREVLARLDCPLRAVRLLRLGPGGMIHEHRDYDLGYDRGEARLHVPVVTNADVAFHLRNRRVDMAPGETWYLDLSQPHRVFNGGATDRIHLVIDVGVNDWLRELIPFEAVDPFRPTWPQVEPEIAAANLSAFRALVATRPDLHAALRDTTDRDLFIEETMRLALEHHLPLSAATVRDAMAEERGRWNEQWMK